MPKVLAPLSPELSIFEHQGGVSGTVPLEFQEWVSSVCASTWCFVGAVPGGAYQDLCVYAQVYRCGYIWPVGTKYQAACLSALVVIYV